MSEEKMRLVVDGDDLLASGGVADFIWKSGRMVLPGDGQTENVIRQEQTT
jgi:hypothetical protein